MNFTKPLEMAYLQKRYKRFLADVKLPNGKIITIYCPNTGSMLNCDQANSPIWFSTSDNPKRKYAHTWEIIQINQHKIGINTLRANELVFEAIQNKLIPELLDYDLIKREVKYGEQNSRIDFLLDDSQANIPKCFMEVKNVSLVEDGSIAYFPDAVTLRGKKHLQELMLMKQQGHRAILFFCVQHTGAKEVRPAAHIDAKYAATLQEAVTAGVEVMAYGTDISPQGIELTQQIPVII